MVSLLRVTVTVISGSVTWAESRPVESGVCAARGAANAMVHTNENNPRINEPQEVGDLAHERYLLSALRQTPCRAAGCFSAGMSCGALHF